MKASVRVSPALRFCGLGLIFCMGSVAQQATEPHPAPPILVVNVNRVLIPVVVRDKQGRSISDLKKEDFQVLDNGMLRAVSGFTVENRGALLSGPMRAGGVGETPGPAGAVTDSLALPKRITVFLFDDMHLSSEELPYVQKASVKALPGALANSDMAGVVTTSGKTNSGLTRDQSKLQRAIMSLRPTAIYRSSSADCPNIGYY